MWAYVVRTSAAYVAYAAYAAYAGIRGICNKRVICGHRYAAYAVCVGIATGVGYVAFGACEHLRHMEQSRATFAAYAGTRGIST